MDGKIETKDLGKVGMFTSNRRKNLRLTRIYVIQGIKNINSFIVMTNFIEESIEFTINKYSQVLESGIRQNSFHIRKVLRTLKDRVKHLKIVSENFVTQGNTLFSRLELYDSEIAFEIQQKIEKLAFIIGLIGIILAVVAIMFEVFFN